ncbi:MAG: hypothetical protein K2J99_02545 [Lachnospiraceae bacterium]|nr:hypothetical protein [Lachnospiraceae bacterium]
MKKSKNRLDEMQEQKMLKIEHDGFWIGFAGLAIVIIIQVLYYGLENCRDYILGEFIVFLCMGVYTMVGCVSKGVWDRRLAPSWKVNLYASLLAGVLGGTLRFITVWHEYHLLWSCMAVGVIVGIGTFILTFGVLSISLFAYKQREHRLERELSDEEEDK